MQYLLLFHGNNGYTNAPQYYVIAHCLFCLNYKPASPIRRILFPQKVLKNHPVSEHWKVQAVQSAKGCCYF